MIYWSENNIRISEPCGPEYGIGKEFQINIPYNIKPVNKNWLRIFLWIALAPLLCISDQWQMSYVHIIFRNTNLQSREDQQRIRQSLWLLRTWQVDFRIHFSF